MSQPREAHHKGLFSELARLWRGSILIIARISADLRSLACCRIRLETARSRILHGRRVSAMSGPSIARRYIAF
jgi:hypothetical protein